MTLRTDWASGNYVYAADLNAISDAINSSVLLTTTDVQTSNFSASGGTIIPCDATGGSFTVTLPELPADDARIVVKKIDTSSGTITVAATGSTRFDKVGGSTSLTLNVKGETVSLHYRAESSVWYIVADTMPTTSFGKQLLSTSDASAARVLIGAGTSSETFSGIPDDGSVTQAKLDSTFYATLATLSDTQTLSGKTLVTPRIGTINDTNGNPIVTLSPTTSATNYLRITNTTNGSSPIISAVGTSDTNVGILLAPKGNGKLGIYAATGQTPTLTAAGADSNHHLDLVSKGTGVVRVNGVEAASTTGTQELRNKTISGTYNTFSNIPLSALTGIAPSAGATTSTDYEVIGTSTKVAAGTLSSIGSSLQSSFILPKINNDLAFHFMRGGTVSVFRNGSVAVANTDYVNNIETAFSPKSDQWILNPSATNDIYVIEVSHVAHTSFSAPTIYGIDMRAPTAAKSVAIALWNSSNSSWVSVGSVTENMSGFYAKTFTALSSYTKIRYTLTDFSSTQCRISSIFATSYSGNGIGNYFFTKTGGSLYGTASSPPTISASGVDSNIGINLVTKGSGVVKINGYEVLTTLTGSVGGSGGGTGSSILLDGAGRIKQEFLPISSYAATIGDGISTNYTITHNLNTFDVSISVWDNATGVEVNCDKTRDTNGTVTLSFEDAPSLNSYRVLILSNGGLNDGENPTPSIQPTWSSTTLTTDSTLSSVAGFTYIVLLSGSGAPTLPSAVGNSSRYIIKNIHETDELTVHTTADQTIEGQATLPLLPGHSVEIISDQVPNGGANWRII